MDMSMLQYQVFAHESAIYPAGVSSAIAKARDAIPENNPNEAVENLELQLSLQYVALGLTGEAGEFAGKVKKIIRDKGCVLDDKTRAELIDELGDVLWYVAETASVLGAHLSQVASMNVAKLRDRQERGALKGSGDHR